MARPVIALLTDFGTRDHYVGAMKGAALSVCPEATLVDITHDIPAHAVLAGALELAAVYKYFPEGTIFLVVVDPGVGSERRGIAAATDRYRFVAPDNGVLALALKDTPPNLVVELAEPRYARPVISRTFEGRDRFAPAAGWLASGVDLSSFGPQVQTWEGLSVPEAAVRGRALEGEVLRVDRFGNLVTNIDRRAFEEFVGSSPVEISLPGTSLDRVVGTYADALPDSPCALFGSSGHLEIALNGGSAAARFALKRGARITITRRVD
jgi:S-adenosylmethionine hydrolase